MKKLQRIVSVLALGSAMTFSCMAEAYNSWSAVMNTRATAYTDSNLTKRNGVEYADKGDAVTVLDESPKAYLVRYPLSRGGYKERWVVRTAVTGVSSSIANAANTAIKNAVTAAQNNYQQWQGIAKWRATAYTNSALSQRNGVEYVDKGDTVTVLNEAGNAYYVRYPLARGGTKDRWISKSAIDKPARGADALAQASSHAQSTANQAQSVQRTYGSWPAVMNRRAVAYTDENLTKRNGIEYADKGDNVTVLNESAKGYLVKYPLSKGGYKERWVARSAVTATGSTNVNTGAIASAMQNAAQTAISANQFSYLNANDTNVERPSNANYSTWKGVANIRATAYLNSSLTKTSSIEWVGKGDTVTVYGEQGNAYFVEYPLSKGGVKHRWVRKNVINNSSSNNNIMNASGDIVKLNVPKYSQYDSRWKDTYIGNKTIGKVGCLVTSLAMKYSYETGQTVYPNQMKDLLTFNNNDLCWSSVRKLGYTDRDMTFNISLAKEIYNALLNNKPVVTGNTSKHWVVIIGCANNNADNLKASDFLIIDPYYDNIKNLQGFFNKIGTTRGKVIY